MKRRRTWIVLSVIAAVVLTAVVTTEIVARSLVSERLTSTIAQHEGVTASLGATPALIQLAAGSADVTITVTDSGLAGLAACATALDDLQVSATPAGLAVATERSIRGFTVPVTILLVPDHSDAGWVFRADSVSVAGIAIPASRAATMLGQGNAALMLREGIPLGGGDGATQVTGVTTGNGYLAVSVRVPLASDSPRVSLGKNKLLGCLANDTTREVQQ